MNIEFKTTLTQVPDKDHVFDEILNIMRSTNVSFNQIHFMKINSKTFNDLNPILSELCSIELKDEVLEIISELPFQPIEYEMNFWKLHELFQSNLIPKDNIKLCSQEVKRIKAEIYTKWVSLEDFRKKWIDDHKDHWFTRMMNTMLDAQKIALNYVITHPKEAVVMIGAIYNIVNSKYRVNSEMIDINKTLAIDSE